MDNTLKLGIKLMSTKYLKEMIFGLLWFVALVCSQFYIFASGLPQPSHMVFAVIILFTVLGFFIKGFDKKYGGFYKYIFLFLGYSTLVNLIWSIIEQDPEFLLATVYWFFGTGLLISCVKYLSSESHIEVFKVAIFIGILILAVFSAVGIGRYDFFPRYNGFFNDPNQMAFWVICLFSFFILISSRSNSKLIILVLSGLSVYIVMASLSRSALVGLFFVIIGIYLKVQGFGSSKDFKKAMLTGFLSLCFIIGIVLYSDFDFSSLDIVERILNTRFDEQADIRGYYRAIQFPEYLFLGAGQGLDFRFNSPHEIHSSWMALFFYYGFVGSVLFLLFLSKIFFRLDIAEKFIFLGPLFYGFSTYGLRTPVFWLFLAAAIYASREKYSLKKSIRIE